MILEIRLSNFFSIMDEVMLDMQAANIQTKKAKALAGNTFKHKGVRLLKTVAIYGANASGKSNIIKAIRACVSMIYNSHNHNENTAFPFTPSIIKRMKKVLGLSLPPNLNGVKGNAVFSLWL